MRRRRMTVALAAAALPLAVAATSAGASPSAHARVVRVGHLVPATAGAVLPTRDATVSSLNWAGYTVLPGLAITGVKSTFTVPKAGVAPPGFSASWAGIGGYNPKDLIQAGTTSDTVGGGTPRYYAWYEILPDSERLIIGCSGDAHCTVRPGNRVSVDIHAVGANLWSVSLVNSGHWSWHSNISYHSSQSSAEWILEAPTVGAQTTVANVGTAYFGTENTWTAAGQAHAIQTGHPVKINMGVFEAVTSGLASNWKSFNVCTYALRCPTPAH